MLILIGWLWDTDSSWSIDMAVTDIDGEGWSYAVDFPQFTNDNHPDALTTCGGSGIKSMVHFVRRRRLRRLQYFDGNLLLSL
jgi:hypothetical protein